MKCPLWLRRPRSPLWLRRLICRKKGHDWLVYVHSPWSYAQFAYQEQAGYCRRCGFDTHATIEE